ncbi:MAG TPA: tellurite resistance TerB family protein [Caulobacterales bacterium]|nr:tellurite resistance TerB family protein [Caulobacterales bacterium]
MDQFFVTRLGEPKPLSPNVLDWGRLVEARRLKPESAWSAPEALLCVLLATALCDKAFSTEEREYIRAVTHHSKGLRTLTQEQLNALQWIVVDRLKAGVDLAVNAACAALPADLRLPAFAQALDVALWDGDLSQVEAEFLDELAVRLGVSESEVRRIADVILLKNQC